MAGKPACVDSDCHGDQGKCTMDAHSGCQCWDLLDVAESYTWDNSIFDGQQALLAAADFPNPGNPACLGIGTQDTVSRAAGALAINDFCGGGPISNNLPLPFYTKVYNDGTANAMRIMVEFGSGYQIPKDACKDYLFTILDGCDGGSADNPGNMKHGGTIQYQGGASLSLTPLGGSPIYCNTYQALKWVDIGVGVDAAMQFCTDQSLTGHPGTRITHTYNSGQPSSVTLTLSYYGDYTMSNPDCVRQFRLMLDNCDHNDFVNNPADHKFGGTYTNEQGAVFIVMPG